MPNKMMESISEDELTFMALKYPIEDIKLNEIREILLPACRNRIHHLLCTVNGHPSKDNIALRQTSLYCAEGHYYLFSKDVLYRLHNGNITINYFINHYLALDL